MDREGLLVSATRLRQPRPQCAKEYGRLRESLVARMNGLMEARSDITRLVGEGNLGMMLDNHRNHARFMEAMFHEFSPAVLVETVLWVFRAYRQHGFAPAYWAAQLDCWVEVLRGEISAECFDEIYPFYHWMIVNIPVFTAVSEGMAGDGPGPGH